MGSRLHNIREALHLVPELRSEENINDICDFVKDVKFFARLSVLQQRSLCRTMSLEEFAAREFIFEIGETGDKFYIILTGGVGVQVPSQTAPCPNDVHADRCDCPNRPLEIVVFLEKGMGFGELALQSDQPRSATIQTSEKTELLVTKRCDYEMYAGQLHRQFIEQRVKFLRQCPRIEDALQVGLVSTQDIAAMANCLNEVQLAGNAIACRQGDVVDHMIFVRSGQLATLRCVDLEQTRDTSPPSRGAVTTKSPRHLRSTMVSAGASCLKGTPAHTQQETKGEQKVDGGEFQPQWQLTQNLAKAMMDVKRKDRKAKLENLDGKNQEDDTEAADSRSQIVTSPTSVARGSSSGPGSMEAPEKAKKLWQRLQVSLKAATNVDRFLGGSKIPEETGVEAANKNVEHFASVQAARRMYTQFTFKKLMGHEKKGKPHQLSSQHRKSISRKSVVGVGISPPKVELLQSPSKKRMRILRIGTLGPYEYFGDQQVCNNETYPVSLVSDPVAEIYVMSKHDILRRVPKKLFNALFNLEKEAVPSDVQLLEMHKQTERWNAFRRSMHGEALGNLSARRGGGVGMRDRSSGSRIDAVANLEFLGINPSNNLGESLLPLPQNKGVALTPKDEELFSQASARFLRRFDIMKRDPGLREALARAGLMRNSRLHDGLPGSALDDDDRDPMAFRFDQHWYKLQKDPIGLDLDDVLSEDTSKQLPAVQSAPVSAQSSPQRSSVARTGRRGSQSTDPHSKQRVSVGGSGAHNHGSFAEIVPDDHPSSPGLPPRGLGGAQRQSSHAASSSMGAAGKRRPSRMGADVTSGPSGTAELPPLDTVREGKSSSRPASTTNSSTRRVVGFSES